MKGNFATAIATGLSKFCCTIHIILEFCLIGYKMFQIEMRKMFLMSKSLQD